MFCKNCGKELKEGSVFCANCGELVKKEDTEMAVEESAAETIQEIENEVQAEKVTEADEEKFCPKCGKSLSQSALFCGGCGYSYNGDTGVVSASVTKGEKQKGKGKIIALIIALVMLAVVGTGLGLYASGVFDSFFAKDEVEDKVEEKTEENKTEEENNTAEEEETESELEEDNIEEEKVEEKDIRKEEEKANEEVLDEVEKEDKEEEEGNEDSEVIVNNIPQISKCTAISTLKSDGKNTYSPENLLDSNPATAWVEGQDDEGIGDYIHVYLDERSTINEISILNGYCKDEERYFNNNRVKDVEITLLKQVDENGTSEVVARRQCTLTDGFNAWQTIALGNPVECDWINIMIGSVYPGEKYNDTCISEIKVN